MLGDEYTLIACNVVAYFLEDTIELLDFEPPVDTRKRKKGKKDDDDDTETGVEGDENMNKLVSDAYSEKTRNRVASLSEKEISFELVEVWFIIRLCVGGFSYFSFS